MESVVFRMAQLPTSPSGRISGYTHFDRSETGEIIAAAAEEMGSLVRSTLGPAGLDKLVVRRQQDDEIRGLASNDGISIIEEFEGETNHPVAQHFIETAEAQEDDYGDGTTTTVLLTSELLTAGIDLVSEGVAPTTVVEGFSIAAQRTLEVWDESSVSLATPDGASLDRDRLRNVAITGMTNGSTKSWSLHGLADPVVEAVLRVSNPQTGSVDLSFVRTEAMPGGGVADSSLVPGTFLPKEPYWGTGELPVAGPALLVDGDVAPRDPTLQGEVTADTNGFDGIRSVDDRRFDDIVNAIRGTGASAVLASGDIHRDIAQQLGSRGVLSVQNVKESRIEFLARATGASVSTPLVSPKVISADATAPVRVEQRFDQEDDSWLAVTATGQNVPEAVSFVVRGGSDSVAREAERRVKDGLNAVRAAVMRPQALPGGGAAEIAAAVALRDFAPGVTGRAQLAVETFADAIETIPLTLARNAGLDSLGTVLDLRNRHARGHGRAGITADGTVVDDVFDHDAFDPQLVRTSGFVRGVEFANSYLRIDSILYNATPDSPLDGAPSS